MKIKICGVTRPEDAKLCSKMGATHIGCVVAPDALRYVTPGEAKDIFAAAPEADSVLVFDTAENEAIISCAAEAGTKTVQLRNYNELEARALEEKGFTVWRVFDVLSGTNMLPPMAPPPSLAQPALLDVTGGTSVITFPWELLGPDAPTATFISGGVRPENVCALLTHHPYGIDISSGLEITQGVKDPDRLKLFFDTIERALA